MRPRLWTLLGALAVLAAAAVCNAWSPCGEQDQDTCILQEGITQLPAGSEISSLTGNPAGSILFLPVPPQQPAAVVGENLVWHNLSIRVPGALSPGALTSQSYTSQSALIKALLKPGLVVSSTSGAGLELIGCTLMTDCWQVQALQEFYCATSRLGQAEVSPTAVHWGSLHETTSDPSIQGTNITVTCDAAATLPLPPCTARIILTGDDLWNAMDAAAVFSMGLPTNASQYVSYISIQADVTLGAYRLSPALHDQQVDNSSYYVWNQDVIFEGSFPKPGSIPNSSPPPYQFDWGGLASKALLSVGCTTTGCGRITFSRLTLSNLPIGSLYNPLYAVFPWTLSPVFMWGIRIPRMLSNSDSGTWVESAQAKGWGQVPGNASLAWSREALNVTDCDMIVAPDEMDYWSRSSPKDINILMGLFENSETIDNSSYISAGFSVQLIITSSNHETGNELNVTNSSYEQYSLSMAGRRMRINRLQGSLKAWVMTRVDWFTGAYAQGAYAWRSSMIDEKLLKTGLTSLGPSPWTSNPAAAQMAGWGMLTEDSTVDCLSLFTDGQARTVASANIVWPKHDYNTGFLMLGDLIVNSSSLYTPWSPVFSSNFFILTGDPGDPHRHVLYLRWRTGGSPLAQRLGRRSLHSHQQHDLPALGGHTGMRNLRQASATLPAGPGIITVPQGQYVSLRHIVIREVGPAVGSVNVVTNDPLSPNWQPEIWFGNFTSFLWLFNIRRTAQHQCGLVELLEVTVVLPPAELSFLMALLLNTNTTSVEKGDAYNAQDLLNGYIHSMQGQAVVTNPTFNATLPNPSIFFPSFTWWGQVGNNVTWTTDLTNLSQFPALSLDLSRAVAGDVNVPPGEPRAPNKPQDDVNTDISPRDLGIIIGLSLAGAVSMAVIGTLIVARYLRRKRNFMLIFGAANEDKTGLSPDGGSSCDQDGFSSTASPSVVLTLGGAGSGEGGLTSDRAWAASLFAVRPLPAFRPCEAGRGTSLVSRSLSAEAEDDEKSFHLGALPMRARGLARGNSLPEPAEGGALPEPAVGGAPGGAQKQSSSGRRTRSAVTLATAAGQTGIAPDRAPRQAGSRGTPLTGVQEGRGEVEAATDNESGPQNTRTLLSHIFARSSSSSKHSEASDDSKASSSWSSMAVDVADTAAEGGNRVSNPRLQMHAVVEKMRMAGGGDTEVELHSQSPLGQGAFGVAYRGTWRGLDVCVKRILFQLLPGPQGDVSRRKAMREAAINATLDHPNVVATYSYDMVPLHSRKPAGGKNVHGPTAWECSIIMEYCDGGSLAALIHNKEAYAAALGSRKARKARQVEADLAAQSAVKRTNEPGAPLSRVSSCPASSVLVLQVARQVAAGVLYLHERNILHGDLKSDNVLLKSNPTQPSGFLLKLADFGMSIALAQNQTHVSGVSHGTPLYIAPEVLHRACAAKSADVYSLAVVLWELCHGKTAWQQLLELTETRERCLGRGMAYIPGLFTFSGRCCMPPAYVLLVEKCLSHTPADRPTIQQVCAVLQALHEWAESSADIPGSPVPDVAALMGLTPGTTCLPPAANTTDLSLGLAGGLAGLAIGRGLGQRPHSSKGAAKVSTHRSLATTSVGLPGGAARARALATTSVVSSVVSGGSYAVSGAARQRIVAVTSVDVSGGGMPGTVAPSRIEAPGGAARPAGRDPASARVSGGEGSERRPP